MADIFSRDKRSEIMRKIRSKDTVAEKIVFRYLRANNVYFQKHYKRAIGCPDIALPRKKKAVFIDGDFWHGRSYEKLLERGGLSDFWIKKLAGNVARDITQRDELQKQGWEVLTIWESDLSRKRTQDETLQKIHHFLKQEE